MVMVEFGGLTEAEQLVLEKVAIGEEADLAVGQEEIDVSWGRWWGKDREIRASFLHALCAGLNSGFILSPDGEPVTQTWPVHPRGVRIRGARITGQLDLSCVEQPWPLSLTWCFFDSPVILELTVLSRLILSGSHVPGLQADAFKSRGEVRLDRGFVALGEVWLVGAQIGGDLTFSGATLVNPDGDALSCDKAKVGGSVYLDQAFRAEGMVRLVRATLVSLYCLSGTFRNRGQTALSCDGMSAAGIVDLGGRFRAEGEVSLDGATIHGDLDCRGGSFFNGGGIALSANNATVDGEVRLSHGFTAQGHVTLSKAKLRSLDCSDGTLDNRWGTALSLDDATVERDAILGFGFKTYGTVTLVDAKLGGLNCSKGTFANHWGDALIADRMAVTASLALDDGFRAIGRVSLGGAHVGGLYCSGGWFDNPFRVALEAERITVTGGVFLAHGFRSDGAIVLLDAKVGSLECDGGMLINRGGTALLADRMTTAGVVRLGGGFRAEGTVMLDDAHIGGKLDCSGGSFFNPDGTALSVVGGTVVRGVFLADEFEARGQVALDGITTAGLSCRKGTFINPHADALTADSMSVTAGVILTGGFSAEGQVSFSGTKLGHLRCTGGRFSNASGDALSVRNARIGKDAEIDGEFDGSVRFLATTVEGGVDCEGGIFRGHPYAFDGERMNVKGIFTWRPAIRPVGIVDLADAHVSELRDGTDSWPAGEDRVDLNGFTYESFGDPGSGDMRLSWVRRYYSAKRYVPHPYEQLSACFRRAGQDDDARIVLIGKEHARRASLSRWRQPGHWLFGLTVGYGHRLWPALTMLVLLVAVGAPLFARANTDCLVYRAYTAEACALVPTTDARELPDFQPVMYALDTVLPIIDLRQQDFWTPKGAYTWWFWFSIVGGWVLTTALVAGLTRVVSKN